MIALKAAGPVTFADGSRLFGTGSRSDAVDRRGRSTEAYVCDGPFRPEDRLYPRALVPPWASCERDDATYFPLPWVLSARGYGVLADHDERVTIGSRGERGFTVSAEAPALALRVFGGPTPADACDGSRATRQAAGAAAAVDIRTVDPDRAAECRAAGRGGGDRRSAAGGRRAGERGRDADALPSLRRARSRPGIQPRPHRAVPPLGLAHLVYLNPLLCTSYSRVWQEAAASGALQRERSTGLPHIHPAFVGGAAPLGFSAEPLSQFDFTAAAQAAVCMRAW